MALQAMRDGDVDGDGGLPSRGVAEVISRLWGRRPMWENGDGMTLQELRATRRDSVLGLAAKHGAHNVRVFGSVARGESDPQSDVDFLVDLDPGRTISDLGGLLMDLQEALGAPVDVVTERGLRVRVRERVLAEAVVL